MLWIILVIAAVWLVLNVWAFTLFRASSSADRREDDWVAELEARRALADLGAPADASGEGLDLLGTPDLYPGGYAAMLLKRLAVQACRMVGVDCAAILVSDGPSTGFVLAAGHHIEEGMVGARFVDLDDAPEVPRVLASSELDPQLAGCLPPGSSTVIVKAVGRRRAGVLVAAGEGPFSERDLALARHLADLVAASLNDAGLGGHLDAALEGGVRALEAALDGADLRSAGSSRDLVALASELGSRLGLDAPALVELQLAARLRGAGALLERDRGLDAGPAAGGQILTHVPGLEVVALIVGHERERWDGHGVPDGLAADRIPLASRILAVAADFCDLTAPEGGALSAIEALSALADRAGRAYDPTVVEATGAVVAPEVAPFLDWGPPAHEWAAGDLAAAAA